MKNKSSNQARAALLIAIAALLCSIWKASTLHESTGAVRLIDGLTLIGTIVIAISAILVLARSKNTTN